ncbi:MAG: hypothetical protein ABI970_10510 [Chloroflexota bacterium]
MNESENKTFRAALAQMRESELARLLDRVETLAQDFQRIPLRKGESLREVAAAQKALKIWKAEVKHILRLKQMKDSLAT